MKNKPAIVLQVFLLLWLTLPVFAEAADPRPALPTPNPPAEAPPSRQSYPEAALLERQHAWSLYAVDSLIRRVRPGFPESPERLLPMLTLDECLHYAGVPGQSTAAESFCRARYEVAAFEMERSEVQSGALIWKIYNHGFVVRTKSVTVAFDLTRSWWGMRENQPEWEAVTRRIIDRCDALFISHLHGDHQDDWVIQTFRDQGKPVLMPDSLKRDGKSRQPVALSGGREVQAVVFPGYQSELENNVTVVFTPEGMSFAHTGDLFQGNATPIALFDWIDHVKDTCRVDVLMVNIWVMDLHRVVRGFDPVVVIPGHENEVGHGIDKRKPFYLDYDRLKGLEYPGIVMAWGESFYYQPEIAKKFKAGR